MFKKKILFIKFTDWVISSKKTSYSSWIKGYLKAFEEAIIVP